ncbi:MAG: EF-hand domain-containing protein [Acidovorax sp.]|nr:EF-hand domain-containing protein [Acidovorax sp.]MDH4425413.1 EF-hand domain-containing protein [Acidovorax sp.]
MLRNALPCPAVAVVLAVTLWGWAWAQPAVTDAVPNPAPAAGPSKGEVKAMREFKMLDMNGDGRLSRTEVLLFPRLSAAFDDADTNRDRYVSYEEVRAFAVRYRAERERSKAAAQGAGGSTARSEHTR